MGSPVAAIYALVGLKISHVYYRSSMAIRKERWNDLDLSFHIVFAK
jgi:hypothetical protein